MRTTSDQKGDGPKPPSARALLAKWRQQAAQQRIGSPFVDPFLDKVEASVREDCADELEAAMAEPAAPPPLVYLASPYSHSNPAVREQRFAAACRATTRLIEAGEMIFSPIVHAHPLVEYGAGTDWQTWQRYDRAMIDYCGEVRVLMIAGWVESVGVQAEIAYAKEHGKQVTYTCMEALPAQVEDAAPPQGERLDLNKATTDFMKLRAPLPPGPAGGEMTVEVQPDGYKTVAVADCCAVCAYFGIQSRGYVCRRIMVRGYRRNEGHLRYATIEANGWCSQFLRQKKYTVAPAKETR